MREKHWSCMCPNQGLNPQPRHVPWPEIKLVTFCFGRCHPTDRATLVRASPKDLFVCFKIFIYLLLGRGKERETLNMWVIHQLLDYCGSPTRDLAHNPGMCPDWELNQHPLDWQAGAQSIEPHQPGPKVLLII